MSLWSTVVTQRRRPLGARGHGVRARVRVRQRAPRLLESLQVVDQSAQVAVRRLVKPASAHPGLIACAFVIQRRRLSGVLSSDASAEGRAAGQVGEVGAYADRWRRCSPDGVAAGAGVLQKYLLAVLRRRGGRCGGWLPLLLDPGIELVPRLDGHAQPHPGVLQPAVLCAGAHVVAQPGSGAPTSGSSCPELCLRIQPNCGTPEAVDHVGALQIQA